MHMQGERDITDTPVILTWDGQAPDIVNIGANVVWSKAIANYEEFATATISAAAASGLPNEVDIEVGGIPAAAKRAVGIIIRAASGSPSRVKLLT